MDFKTQNRLFWTIWTILLVVTMGVFAISDYQKLKLNEESETIGVEIFNLINETRKNQGLEELKYNKRLSRAGENHCRDMIENHYFDHNRPDKKMADFVSELRIKHTEVAENISRDINNPYEIIERWLESESHREIMLRDYYIEMGVGVCKKGNNLLVSSYFIK